VPTTSLHVTRLASVRRSVVLLLAALALVAAPGGAVAPDTARAGAYDHLLAPMTKCGGSSQTSTTLPTADQERIMHCLHNWARRKAGRWGLARSSQLYTSSDRKTGDMFGCREYSHTACGRYMRYWFDRVGYTTGGCWGWGENIHWGPGRYGSPRVIMRGWLNSSFHRGNILSSSFREVGLGVRKGTFKGHRGAEVWTAHFGYRC
jgi:uncharacterized protein YkwD